MRVLKWMIDRLEGKAAGTETMFGTSPTYSEINWTGLNFSEAQFNSVTSIDKAAWQVELGLHTEQFAQPAYHFCPRELRETKASVRTPDRSLRQATGKRPRPASDPDGQATPACQSG